MPNKISISNDIAPAVVLPGFLSLHAYAGPTPPFTAPIAAALEIPVPMFWPPGMAMGQNKLTTTVVHKGLSIVQAGHDCGAFILHFQIFVNIDNTLTLLHVPFSSRKVNFSASTVLAQGKPIACATLFSWPPAPMTVCWDPVSPPLSSAPTSHLNTVVVGMTAGDLLLGYGTIAASMLLEFLLKDAGKGIFKKWFSPNSPMGAFGLALLGKLVGGGSIGEVVAKQGLGVATGVAKMLLTDGPADVKISVGSPFFGAEGGLTRDADGNYGVVAGGRKGQSSVEGSVDSKGAHWKTEEGGGAGSSSQTEQGSQPDSKHSWDPTNWGSPL